MREAQQRASRERRQGQISALLRAIRSGQITALVQEAVVQAKRDAADGAELSADQVRLLNVLSALLEQQ